MVFRENVWKEGLSGYQYYSFWKIYAEGHPISPMSICPGECSLCKKEDILSWMIETITE